VAEERRGWTGGPNLPFPMGASVVLTRPVANRRLVSIFDTIMEYGLYFLIVLTPFAFGTVESWSIAIAEVVIFTVALAWGLKMVALGVIRIERTPFNICWLLVLGFGLLQIVPLPLRFVQILSPHAYALYQDMAIESSLNATWRTLSLYPYATKLEILRLSALALLFWVAANHLRTREQVERVVWVVMGTGFLLAMFGIIQHFTWNGKLFWVREFPERSHPFGPYVNRNHFAGYLEMVIPLCLGRIVETRRNKSSGVTGWRDRLLQWRTPEANRALLVFFGGLIVVAALLLSGSRAGLFSFLGSMLFMALLSGRRRQSKRWWAPLALFVALGFAYAVWLKVDDVMKTFAILWVGTDDPSASWRLLVWKDTLRLGRAFLWTGTGLNTFSWAFPLYQSPLTGQGHFTHAENDYLQAFAEGGLPFIGFLALALIWGGAQLLTGWSDSQRSHARGLGLGLLAGLVALLLHSLADFNLHIMANAILFVLLLALATRVLVFGTSPAAALNHFGTFSDRAAPH